MPGCSLHLQAPHPRKDLKLFIPVRLVQSGSGGGISSPTCPGHGLPRAQAQLTERYRQPTCHQHGREKGCRVGSGHGHNLWEKGSSWARPHLAVVLPTDLGIFETP